MVVEAVKTMGRPKGKRTERDDVTVKIERAIVQKARLISAHRGISVAELLSDAARAPIDKAYAQMLRELDAGQSGGAK